MTICSRLIQGFMSGCQPETPEMKDVITTPEFMFFLAGAGCGLKGGMETFSLVKAIAHRCILSRSEPIPDGHSSLDEGRDTELASLNGREKSQKSRKYTKQIGKYSLNAIAWAAMCTANFLMVIYIQQVGAGVEDRLCNKGSNILGSTCRAIFPE